MSAEPEPYLLGRCELRVELDAEGARMFTMNINTSSTDAYHPTTIYDLQAMLGLAFTNLGDPEWRELAYPDGGDVQ